MKVADSSSRVNDIGSPSKHHLQGLAVASGTTSTSQVALLPVATSGATNQLSSVSSKRSEQVLAVLVAVINWLVWFLMVQIVLLQFLSLFWTTTTTEVAANYGQSSLNRLSKIDSLNDDPFSDRAVVCVLQGRSYLPLTVNDTLMLGTTKLLVNDSTNSPSASSINGYRIVKRATSSMTPKAKALYTHTCSVITMTLDAILERCTLLDCNSMRDHLRVVDDIDRTNTYLVGDSLPILMMPYWDNCFVGWFVVPGADGSACMFRLADKYSGPAIPIPFFSAVNWSALESTMIEWLHCPDGT